MVKIRLKKFGTQKRPYYRVVVQESNKARDGVCIEELGYYMPIEAVDKQVKLDLERVKYWVSVGAQPSKIVKKLVAIKSRAEQNKDA